VGQGAGSGHTLWGLVSEAPSCQWTRWVNAVRSLEATHGPVAGLFPPPTSQLDASFEACFAKCYTGCHLRGHLCWQRPVPGHPLPTYLLCRCARKPCPGLDPEPLPGAATALGLGGPHDPTLVPFHLQGSGLTPTLCVLAENKSDHRNHQSPQPQSHFM